MAFITLTYSCLTNELRPTAVRAFAAEMMRMGMLNREESLL